MAKVPVKLQPLLEASADDVRAAGDVGLFATPNPWRQVAAIVDAGPGVVGDDVVDVAGQMAALAWVLCRAVWAQDRSPVFSETAGRLAGFAGVVDDAVARVVKRHTCPDAVVVGTVAARFVADPAKVVVGLAWLCDATVDEVADLYGVDRDKLMGLWPRP